MNIINGYTLIDPAKWQRRAHYELYCAGKFPYVGATVRLDITEALARCKAAGVGFFPAFLHLATTALNEMENFRYRLGEDGSLALCHGLDPSWTVLDERSELFYFGRTGHGGGFADFAARVKAASREAVAGRFLGDGRLDVFYASALRWLDFSSCLQPLELSGTDAIPRLVWGKYTRQGGRVSMAVSCTAHHGFVDGLHLGRLLERLQQLCLEFDPGRD